MDSPWLELLRKKHGTDVHDCFEGTAMEHFAKHYFCGLFKVRHAVNTEQYGQLLESEFQRMWMFPIILHSCMCAFMTLAPMYLEAS